MVNNINVEEIWSITIMWKKMCKLHFIDPCFRNSHTSVCHFLNLQCTLVTRTALVAKDVAFKMNLLL